MVTRGDQTGGLGHARQGLSYRATPAASTGDTELFLWRNQDWAPHMVPDIHGQCGGVLVQTLSTWNAEATAGNIKFTGYKGKQHLIRLTGKVCSGTHFDPRS